MDSELKSQLSALLERQSRELSDIKPSVPTDLAVIRRYLGLGVRVEEARSVKHGALVEEADGSRTIVVYRQTRYSLPLTRARFTVAHEIGHFLVDRATGYRPATNSDYWKLEQLCDSFAGKVLLPDSVLPHIISRCGPADPTQLLVALDQLRSKGRLSLEATARRLADHFLDRGTAVAYGLLRGWQANGRRVDARRGAPVAEVDWVVGEVAGLGRGSRIRSDHPLFDGICRALVEGSRAAAIAERHVAEDVGNTRVILRPSRTNLVVLAAIRRHELA